MHVHRSAHARNFTVLPNGLLQDRRLSYTARGLLADLLSRPDGRCEDGRQMADTSPQGRGAVRRALKELTAAGYYRVETVRLPNGTLRSESHVYDCPYARPDVTRPGSGRPAAAAPVAPSVKDREKPPTLPPPPEPSGPVEPSGPSGAVDEATRVAVATLFRAIRPEPRLRLGEAEALRLAPLVARWLERGSTVDDLARALLPGLPTPLHSPLGVLRSRLERKLPPEHVPGAAPAAGYAECAKCHDPVPEPGICRACAGLGHRPVVLGTGAADARAGVTRAGVTRARAALRGGRGGGLHLGGAATAG
ncbi:hypothetical protein [Kitasatospora sp. NPDC050463]|uniref:hypothetical protein n=1 Tax=Kitasatospora sp. NPDC050463 TaxID=3155786 RepID=UPI0033D66D68